MREKCGPSFWKISNFLSVYHIEASQTAAKNFQIRGPTFTGPQVPQNLNTAVIFITIQIFPKFNHNVSKFLQTFHKLAKVPKLALRFSKFAKFLKIVLVQKFSKIPLCCSGVFSTFSLSFLRFLKHLLITTYTTDIYRRHFSLVFLINL